MEFERERDVIILFSHKRKREKKEKKEKKINSGLEHLSQRN